MTAPIARWYTGTTKWSSVSVWTLTTVTTVGTIRRQTAALGALTVGNERVFVCIIAGTTNATEPTWVLTKGAKTTDLTVTWMECTGQSAMNGDITNTPAWNNANVKNTAIAQGLIIKDVAAANYFICTTAGTAGNGAEPTWNTTAGATTADNTVTWTSLGAVGGFSAWGAPFARLNKCITATWGAAGDTFFVSSNSSESVTTASQVSLNTAVGTAQLPVNIYSVNDGAAPPTALLAGASLSLTPGLTAALNIGFGCGYIYGFSFIIPSGSGNITLGTSGLNIIYDNCTINTGTTAGSVAITNSSQATYINCTWICNNSASRMALSAGGIASIIGGTFFSSGTIPSAIVGLSSGSGIIVFDGCDLSNVTGSVYDYGTSSAQYVQLQNCKLGTGVSISTGSVTSAAIIALNNSDSTSTNYRYFKSFSTGLVQQETTIIRTGGATNGVTPMSWNITSNVATTFYQPFISDQITDWNDKTGVALTATLEINSNSTLTNSQVWMQLEYLGNSSFPISTVTNNRATDIFASPSNVASSTAIWAGGTTAQKLQITFTPQMKGPLKATIFVGKASQTVYVDPRLTITDAFGNIQSSGRQYFVAGQGYTNETAPSFKQIDLTGGMYS